MTYSPNRITKKDVFTDDIILDNTAVQKNFNLVTRETNQLDSRITANERKANATTKILQKQTNFINAFLFG